jgi:TetR/AcrR family transcriptional regulator
MNENKNRAMPSNTDSKTVYSSGEQSILESAEILFAEKGFDAVSMSAIAKLANTSKPNIYHHFKNKDDLYLAIMKAAVHRSSVLLDALEDAPGTFRQHLSGFSAGQLNNILVHKRSTQLILREALSGGSRRGQEIAKHIVGEIFSRLVAMVKQGQQENEFRKDIDPALAAFMVVAANMFFFQAAPVMQHIPEAHFTKDASTYNKGVMDILFNGVLQEGEDT